MRKKMTTGANPATTVLAAMGISLRTLAQYLQVAPSRLSRMCNSNYPLPAHASVKLLSLYTAIVKLQPTNQQSRLAAVALQLLEERANWCLARCHPLKKQLQSMLQQYAQAATMLQLIQHMHQQPENNSAKMKRWLAEQQYQAQKKLDKNGLLPQKNLEIAIGLLQHEAMLCGLAMEGQL